MRVVFMLACVATLARVGEADAMGVAGGPCPSVRTEETVRLPLRGEAAAPLNLEILARDAVSLRAPDGRVIATQRQDDAFGATYVPVELLEPDTDYRIVSTERGRDERSFRTGASVDEEPPRSAGVGALSATRRVSPNRVSILEIHVDESYPMDTASLEYTIEAGELVERWRQVPTTSLAYFHFERGIPILVEDAPLAPTVCVSVAARDLAGNTGPVARRCAPVATRLVWPTGEYAPPPAWPGRAAQGVLALATLAISAVLIRRRLRPAAGR